MGVIIRDYGAAGDAQRVAGVLREVMPYVVTSASVVHAQATGSPARQRYRLLLAEQTGRLLGCVRIGLFADAGDPGLGFANLTVRPGDVGRGAGSALLAAAETHLAAVGATRVFAWATDLADSHSFAVHRGYRRGRSASFLRLDLSDGGPLPRVPARASRDGTRLLPAAHWAADPTPLYRADLESFQAAPGGAAPDPLSYTDWRALTWDRPDFDAELSTVVVAKGEIAAFVLVQTDGEGRYWSGGTGTRHAHRGRGLAKLAKAHSLHRARAAGCHVAYTGNDDGNAPMLAVNRWLGYQPCATQWRYVHDLGPTRSRSRAAGRA